MDTLEALIELEEELRTREFMKTEIGQALKRRATPLPRKVIFMSNPHSEREVV